jgi:general stress protein 26
MNDSNTATTQDGKNPHARLWELMRGIRIAMLTSKTPQGQLHSRPLTVQNKSDEEDSVLYFFISAQNELLNEIEAPPGVNVTFADTDKDAYVSVAGRARVIRDQAKKAAHWTPLAKSWFPKGLDDPDLVLLAVDIFEAEYWDVKSSKMVQLMKMAKAAITGEPPTDLGDHQKIAMR